MINIGYITGLQYSDILSAAALGIALLWGLVFIKRYGSFKLKRVLLMAKRSETEAIQMGGLCCSVVFLYLISRWNPPLAAYKSYIPYIITSIGIGVFYGLLDDFIEIRTRVKLFFHFSLSLILCYGLSSIIDSQFSTLWFIACFPLTILTLNGVNILDGLDLLSYKVFLASLACFSVLFYTLYDVGALTFIAISAVSFIGFWTVNKYPARIHLGEIGPVSIGVILISCVGFYWRNLSFENASATKYFLALIPLNIYLAELGISFLRRVLNGRSPFCRDSLHTHHILSIHRGYTVNQSTNILLGIHLLGAFIPVLLGNYINGVLCFFMSCIVYIMATMIIGYRFWTTEKSRESSATLLFKNLVRREAHFLTNETLDDLEVKILAKSRNDKNKKAS